MTDEDKHLAKVRAFAKEVAWEITGCSRFKVMLKEIVLRVLVEQEELKRVGVVNSFMTECDAKGIRVTLKDDGKLYFTNVDRMDAGLKAVLAIYREEIIRHLAYFRDLETRQKSRTVQKAQSNGSK